MRENFKIFNELTPINIHIGIINTRSGSVFVDFVALTDLRIYINKDDVHNKNWFIIIIHIHTKNTTLQTFKN